jgi:hypothetical protein
MSEKANEWPANEAGRHKALERFGYAEQVADKEWSLLAPGIAPWLAGVRLCDLTDEQRSLALERVRERRELDELMRACDLAHSRIGAGGAGQQLVAVYVAARDRFEDAVESFVASAEALADRFKPAA